MASTSPNKSASPSRQQAGFSPQGPFEWLAGGFFGETGGKDKETTDAGVLLRGISASLQDISNQENKDRLAAQIARLRFLLYDERKNTSSNMAAYTATPPIVGTTLQCLTSPELECLVPSLLRQLAVLPFESRKDVAAVFNYLLVAGFKGSDAAIYNRAMEYFRDYVAQKFGTIMKILIDGHDISQHQQPDVGLHCGSMVRACLRHLSLYQLLVGTTDAATRYVFPLLDTYVHVPNFDSASDAMETVRMIFTVGSNMTSTGGDGSNADPINTPNASDPEVQAQFAAVAAEFLTRDYDDVWTQRFNPKLLSPDSANYMTRRVALQIVSAVLLTRSNYAVMIQFVASRSNLILIMKLLRDTSPHITWDAFHVFKVFVANPNKPEQVTQILKDNQEKLCKYLTTLHSDKEESDAQFRDEKALIIATIRGL